jgi:UDP-N-acetylglucosamine acyltransferase
VKIHSTAIVEDGAVLGTDVEVGPYAIIGSDAIIGSGCRILSHAVITGRVTFGTNNLVGHGAVIGAPPQDFAHNESMVSEVHIGSGNTFREHVTIHRGTKEGTSTTVGNDNLVMVGAHFGHNVTVGSRTIIANNCLLAGYVEIGDGAVLGGGTVFHQHMRVGRLAMVRGGTRFGKDIAPFLVADGENIVSGLNAVGLRRAGFSSQTRIELKRLFKQVFRSSLNVSQALSGLDESQLSPEGRELIAFIRDAKRGICLARGSRPAGAPEEDGEEA